MGRLRAASLLLPLYSVVVDKNRNKIYRHVYFTEQMQVILMAAQSTMMKLFVLPRGSLQVGFSPLYFHSPSMMNLY